MKDVRFITRADDAGSSRSANRAISSVLRAGFIKNVSIMAPGGFVDDAAELFADKKGICFGLHATLNAEWDRVKWGPVYAGLENSGLVDEKGMFLPDPKLFTQTKPSLDIILKELDAQLDKLSRSGFDIRYVDSHMLPEMWVAGLEDAMDAWAQRKGLLYHMYYYALPPGWERVAKDPQQLLPVLRELPSGQYFYLIHPAFSGAEMLLTGNSETSSEQVAKDRDAEARMFSRKSMKWLMRFLSIRSMRYDEAKPGPRLSRQELMQMFGL